MYLYVKEEDYMNEKQMKYYEGFNARIKNWGKFIDKAIIGIKKNNDVSDNVCDNIAKDIVAMYEQTEMDLPLLKDIHILQSFIMAFHNYMTFTFYPKQIEDVSKICLLRLLNTAIGKFDNILILSEARRYEDCLFLYKKYFENLIVMNILKDNNDCIIPFNNFAVYTLSTEGLSPTKEEIEYKVKYGEMLYKNYGWAYSIFKKNDIVFEDLISNVCRKEIFIEQLLKFTKASQYSYTSTVLNPIFDKMVASLFKINVLQMGIPLLVRAIHDVHNDVDNISCEVFLKVANKILPDSYNLKHVIEKINAVDYIYPWPTDEERITWGI